MSDDSSEFDKSLDKFDKQMMKFLQALDKLDCLIGLANNETLDFGDKLIVAMFIETNEPTNIHLN